MIMSDEIKMAKVTTDPVRIMRVSGNGQSIADLAADVAKLQDDVGGIHDDVAGIQDDVGGIQDDVTQLQTDVSGVSSTVSGMASDVSDLSEDVGDLKSHSKVVVAQFPDVNGVIVPPGFVIGQRYVNNGADTWVTNSKRLTFKRGQYIALKEGDTVAIDRSVLLEYFGGYSTDDGESFTVISSRISAYTAPSDGLYFFTFTKLNTAVFTDDDVEKAWTYVSFKRGGSLADDIGDLQTEVDGIQTELDGVDDKFASVDNRLNHVAAITCENAVKGKYITAAGEISINASYAYIFFPYVSGPIEITGASGSGIVNYYDSSDTLIGSTSWTTLTDKTIETASIPTGTAKIALSFGVGDVDKIVIYGNKLSKISEVISRMDKTDNRVDRIAIFTCEGAVIGNYINSSGVIEHNSNLAYVYVPYYSGNLKISGAANNGIISYWNEDKSSQLGNTGWTAINKTIEEPFIPAGTKFVGLSFSKTDQQSIMIYSGLLAEIGAKPENVQDVIYLDNARHIKGETVVPLTILHFSDLHKDTDALTRIVNDAKRFGTSIDGMICTGDIVSNTYEQISSWWESNVMICIGNHDTASYTQGVGYDWTALSMANRSAYYIEPFESGWEITHTAGKSYYYKDYADQKVRLIVMDVMLYNDNGSDATEQTAWLFDLLASAITNSLHVLIAIHAPHGGATAKDCSFSRYGQTAMPTNTDCNTPQAVIDAVAGAITNGLNFIGYLVGHTHQDNIWDAENDGTQMMYCITCACVNQKPQWKNSDQHRSDIEDAYNLVTVDTANTLVKIVRCGGANVDDHMRTRQAICINYSTGEIVGEVL